MRSKSVFLFAALLTAAILVSTAFSQTPKSGSGGAAAEVTRLEQADVEADLVNDPSFMKKYAADDYTGGSSWGNWDTKASILKEISDAKANKTSKEEKTDLKVRTYGDTAIANFTLTYDALFHGEHRARTIICTNTWVNRDGWKLVADHCSERAK